jgi:predicted porin
MKKSLLALAALTAFAGVASAQSSVTLFGIVDLGARQVKNGTTSLKSMSQDGIASSRLGFRGVEDLGGGLRAGFWLEGAIQPDIGTSGGQSWQRRSTLSLMGGFGELRLGRDYTPSFWNHTVFDPFGTNGVGSQTNLQTQWAANGTAPNGTMFNAGATTLVRANNSIGYFLPAMGGLYGQVMVAHSDGSQNGNGYKGLRLGFAGGPVNVAFGYGQTEITPTNDQTGMNLGASFRMGNFTLFGQWHKYEVDVPANTDQTNLMIGGTLAMGAGTLKFSYGKASADVTSREATQIAVGYVHDLSKRTALYGTYASISNEAGARFAVAGTPAAGAPAFTGTDNKPKSTGIEVGVRHTF